MARLSHPRHPARRGAPALTREPAKIEIRVDPIPDEQAFAALWLAAWDEPPGPRRADWNASLVHLGAYAGDALVGYVNVATDGGVHAFLLDPMVHPGWRRRGLGRRLVERAAELARQRGAEWLHVDYEPHLEGFYRACGFRPTAAGVMRLKPQGTGT